jgi:outer membrane protein, multidrug efflux system
MSSVRPIITSAGSCAAVTAALLGACTAGPNFVRPAPQAPEHWSAQATAPPSNVSGQAAELGAWWNGFDDPTLDSLIERAVASNLDLHAAVLRIEEARAQRAIAAAAFWPTLSVDAAYTRQRFSETTPSGSLFNSVGNVHLPGGASISIPNPYNQVQLSAGASWELDLFGRVRRSVEAARAGVQVSVEDRRAVLVSVLADVAQSYMELRGAQARLSVARQNLATIEELLDLTRQRRAAGLTTHIDVANAAAQAAATRAELPAFELEITQSINQLSQLLAREPGALRSELEDASPVPPVPPEVSIGLPADLARRRPDIREAEANLHAATAEIGVAVADLFPRLTLAASGGFQSETPGNLLEWASRFGSLGPTLDLPIFDRGRWKTVRLYDVRAQEAALAYRRTVLNALHDVENALAAYGADRQRRAWLDATVAQNRDALALSRQRYDNGVVTFIDVLDAERTLRQNQLSLADSVTAVSTDLVRVYRALGGGWQQDPPPAG